MPDDYTLLCKMAEAGSNVSGFTSTRTAGEVLAMIRVVQEHDALELARKQAKEAVQRELEARESRVHPLVKIA